MIQVILIYCSLANPQMCREDRPLYEDPPSSLVACMTTAQLTAATYVQEHPGWRLANWRCEMGKPQERRA